MNSNPGVHRHVQFGDYLKWEAANWSTLKHFQRSCLHGRYNMLRPPVANASQVIGGALDVAVFEGPEAYERLYATMPQFPGHPNSNVHKEAKAAWLKSHEGAIELTPTEGQKVKEMLAALQANKRAWALLTEGRGQSQLSILWDDAETGIRCKGRVDRLSIVPKAALSDDAGPGDKVLVLTDLKSSRAPGPREFERECLRFSYHGQLASYRAGLQVFDPADMAVCIVAIENQPPYDVVVHRFSEEFLDHGWRMWRRLLTQYAECVKSGRWPGMCGDVNLLLLPPWGREDEPLETETVSDDDS